MGGRNTSPHYDEGTRAFDLGVEVGSNPHNNRSVAWWAWRSGFLDARETAKAA